MLVRLAFSVMIQVDAEILLIDEVLAVGDAAFQQKCYDEFNRLRDEGRTILLVTHDMATVARFCDRAMLLEQGDVVSIGDPDVISAEYFETNFAQDGPTQADRRLHEGDGTVEIADAWFEDGEGRRVNTLAQGRRAAFVAVVQFVDAHQDPVFAFSLSTDEHDVAFATSTLWGRSARGRSPPASASASGSRSTTTSPPAATTRRRGSRAAAAATTSTSRSRTWRRWSWPARAPAAAWSTCRTPCGSSARKCPPRERRRDLRRAAPDARPVRAGRRRRAGSGP